MTGILQSRSLGVDGEDLECVDRFHFLGDVIDRSGGDIENTLWLDEVQRASSLFNFQSALLKDEGKGNSACVSQCMTYGV